MDVTRANKAEEPDTPDPKAVEAIGRALAAHYAALVQAPVPDKFAELLARLEAELLTRLEIEERERDLAPQRRRDALG